MNWRFFDQTTITILVLAALALIAIIAFGSILQ